MVLPTQINFFYPGFISVTNIAACYVFMPCIMYKAVSYCQLKFILNIDENSTRGNLKKIQDCIVKHVLKAVVFSLVAIFPLHIFNNPKPSSCTFKFIFGETHIIEFLFLYN